MKRIDAHQHFWRLERARREYTWLTEAEYPELYRDFLPGDLAPLLSECGIERTILVQGAETVAETEFLLGIAHETPFVGGVVGWVDFAARDAPALIERLADDRKLVGLRPMLQSLDDDEWVLQPALGRTFDALQRHALTFDALVFPRQLSAIERLLRRYPDLAVVIDHGAKPYIARGEIEPWKSTIAAIARDSGAFCKLSGLATEAASGWSAATLEPYVDVLIESFGPDRLMWGSDWPVLNVAGDYPTWYLIAQQLTARLSADDRARIFGETAARFYGVD